MPPSESQIGEKRLVAKYGFRTYNENTILFFLYMMIIIEEPHDWYSPPNTIRVKKSRRVT